jgi:hypothetical protein
MSFTSRSCFSYKYKTVQVKPEYDIDQNGIFGSFSSLVSRWVLSKDKRDEKNSVPTGAVYRVNRSYIVFLGKIGNKKNTRNMDGNRNGIRKSCFPTELMVPVFYPE